MEITYAEALNQAYVEEMERDQSIVAYGEDFTRGYVWPVSRGLLDRFGPQRIRDVPICEGLHVGMAVGAGMTGLRPVLEMQYSDFVMLGMDGLVNQAAKLTYMTGGQVPIRMVVRLPYGHLRNYGAQHSQSLYGMFASVPGLTICAPAFPSDAKALLKQAMRADRPVMFFEHKSLYGAKGSVGSSESILPFGRAKVYGDSPDVVIVAIGWMVHEALAAQKTLAETGVRAVVIDPRTLVPMDVPTIVEAVKRCGRIVIADEAPLTGGFTGWLASRVQEDAFDYLEAPIGRVGVRDIPIPYSWTLETEVIPDRVDITAAVQKTMEY
ncbi:alpha-ketoacid dehydrogenase subunit beta [Cryobacterium sp. Y50]|uniref:alpha-ketoacid dehydrogenase subunit beta n=1 Tax=Cryobacterium sp. Y50 TaxID=2048286 RepID=UPI0013048D14|nr:transketolase C-terminal domain-containing protein [Cryobacterium sp. Y50]